MEKILTIIITATISAIGSAIVRAIEKNKLRKAGKLTDQPITTEPKK